LVTEEISIRWINRTQKHLGTARNQPLFRCYFPVVVAEKREFLRLMGDAPAVVVRDYQRDQPEPLARRATA
jgi:hypothetical protein